MSHTLQIIGLALLAAGIAAPAPGQPAAPPAPRPGAAAAEPEPGRAAVIVEPAPDSSAVRIARAANAEGRPVSVEALRPPQAVAIASRGRGKGLTSGFGYRVHPILGGVRFHAGIDIARPAGTRVIASSDGRVVQAGWASGYGLLVTIDHGRGLQTRYAHLSSLGVAPGQQVRRGDVLGSVGSTGRSTGPHLHYELRLNGQPVSPVPASSGH